MTNQNKCDHVVGEYNVGDGTSERALINQIELQGNYKNYLWSFIHNFKFCPDCGAKIDWEKIKGGLR